MNNEENVKDYLSNGKKLTPLSGKRPILPDWVNYVCSEEELDKYDGNFGWVINPSSLVIDVDPKNGGKESFKLLSKFLDVELDKTVITPSGGFHIYLTMPEEYVGKAIRKTLNKDFPGIDFLTDGCQCVIVGSKTEKGEYLWADDFGLGFHQTPAPKKLFELISYDPIPKNSELAEYAGLLNSVGGAWTIEKVESLLDKLDPSMGNDDWVKVGMALHDWDINLGLESWEKWSKGGDNYVEGQTAVRWNSFDHGGGVTLGTISYMAKSVDFDESKELLNRYLTKIGRADDRSLELDIIPKLRKENLNFENREIVAKAIQDRCKELSGVKLPIGRIREKIVGQEIISGNFIQDDEKPKWCEPWIYVLSHNAYCNTKTMSMFKQESFNLENGKFIPKNPNGTKPKASSYVSDGGFIPTVESKAYFPSLPERLVNIDTKTYLNMFNPKSIPITANQYTEKGKEAIAITIRHIELICGKKEYASILTQWLAYQVQFPGVKILWCPVIQGIQGIGKSFIGELIKACLGHENVGIVTPSQVKSDFNIWAINKQVNILNEMRVVGNNRFEIANALKPLITDSFIQINAKGINQYTTHNVTNYICFTNHKDAVPIDKDDRRWWVIFVRINSINELTEIIQEPTELYFKKLFQGIAEYSPEIRKWLLEYKISDDFISMKTAPMTEFKQSMIDNEKSNIIGLLEVEQELQNEGRYYDQEVISSSDLFCAMEANGVFIKDKQKNLILQKLGYTPFPVMVKIDRKIKKIWHKKIPINNDEIRQHFKNKRTDLVDDFDTDL